MTDQQKGGLDSKAAGNRAFLILALLCAAAFLAGFAIDAHGHFEMEDIPGFYALYGFIMFTGLILVARALRVFIKRPEDYYAPYAIDAEDYPEDQLDKAEHDA